MHSSRETEEVLHLEVARCTEDVVAALARRKKYMDMEVLEQMDLVVLVGLLLGVIGVWELMEYYQTSEVMSEERQSFEGGLKYTILAWDYLGLHEWKVAIAGGAVLAAAVAVPAVSELAEEEVAATAVEGENENVNEEVEVLYRHQRFVGTQEAIYSR